VIVTIAVIAFLAGALAGALLLWRLLPERLKHHVDYKQRWEDAVGLLGTQGQLTAEQIAQITPDPCDVPPAASPEASLPAETLHRMESWDRKDLEIARARQGLPPVDDLRGMESWDKKAVLTARAKAGTG
jgi:hypothetical protein